MSRNLCPILIPAFVNILEEFKTYYFSEKVHTCIQISGSRRRIGCAMEQIGFQNMNIPIIFLNNVN
jgi:hypothetical protein